VLVRLTAEYRRWAGEPTGGSANPNDVWDVPDDEAARLIEQGAAIPVRLVDLEPAERR